MSERVYAQADEGSAMSTVFFFDDSRHVAVTIYADGSGSITTYQNKRLRSTVSVPSFAEWRVPTTKHTPGPWVAEGRTVRIPHDRFKRIDCASVADARLIAAAPDLLAALEDFSHMVWALTPVDPELDAALGRCEERARAAIRKAKGEAS